MRQPPVGFAVNGGPEVNDRNAAFTATRKQCRRARDRRVRRPVRLQRGQVIALKIHKQQRGFCARGVGHAVFVMLFYQGLRATTNRRRQFH
jgi:hypothetical protein